MSQICLPGEGFHTRPPRSAKPWWKQACRSHTRIQEACGQWYLEYIRIRAWGWEKCKNVKRQNRWNTKPDYLPKKTLYEDLLVKKQLRPKSISRARGVLELVSIKMFCCLMSLWKILFSSRSLAVSTSCFRMICNRPEIDNSSQWGLTAVTSTWVYNTHTHTQVVYLGLLFH